MIFVDDIITGVHKDNISKLLEIFNNFNENIKFTIEEEKNNKISFLDVELQHLEDGNIITDIYHKPTWSGRYLNYNSHLPATYKRNTIHILVQKIFKVSHQTYIQKNLNQLRDVLHDNNYPHHIINKEMINAINKIKSNNNQQIIQNKASQKYVSIPYVRGLFENIKHLLKPHNITVVGNALSPLSKTIFSHLKDATPKEQQSNLIYKVKCECNASYIGMTKQYLNTRIKQHISDSKTTNTKKKKSALSEHLNLSKHKINLDDVTVINRESNYRKRSIMEMLYIKKHTNLLNKQTDSDYIQNNYNNILS